MIRSPALALALLACAVPRLAPADPLPRGKPEEVGLSSERLAIVGKVMNDQIRKRAFPGAVVGIARRGKIAYLEAFGVQDPAAGTPMRKDAIFRIYSMTKPWTSVAAMALVEEGRIQLGDPVSKHLPAFKAMRVATAPRMEPASTTERPAAPSPKREMTIHDLLRHTSGLAYPGFGTTKEVEASYVEVGLGPDTDRRSLAPAEFTERLSKVLLAQEPGTAWQYGLSTDLLGRVVEAITEKRLSAYLEDVIFRPLGMADSGFSVPTGKLGRVAQPFEADPRTGEKLEVIDVTRVPANDMGGGGGVSTADDYLRFCSMLLGGGRLGKVRVLGARTVSYMTSDHLGHIPAPFRQQFGYGFGLGFAVRQAVGIADHAGSPGDYSWCGAAGTYFWVDPQEELVAVLLVQAPGAGCTYGDLIRNVVYQALVE